MGGEKQKMGRVNTGATDSEMLVHRVSGHAAAAASRRPGSRMTDSRRVARPHR